MRTNITVAKYIATYYTASGCSMETDSDNKNITPKAVYQRENILLSKTILPEMLLLGHIDLLYVQATLAYYQQSATKQ